jgi:hypothetical protein
LKTLIKLSLILTLCLTVSSCGLTKPKPTIVYQAPAGYMLVPEKDVTELKENIAKTARDAAEIKQELINCLNEKVK